MKQKKVLFTLAFAVLWLPQLLFAQKSDAFRSLKPGDWFEVLVSDTARKPDTESYRYNIRYLLKKADADGKKDYTVTFERTKVVFSPGKNAPLGYDSYYPSFKQGILQRTVKPVFSSTVSKTGKVLSMVPAGQFPQIELNEISVRKTYGGSSAAFQPITKETASVISQHIFEAIAKGDRNWNDGRLFKDSGLSFLVSAAYFPLQPNVLIEGHIDNLNQHVRDYLGLYLPGANQGLQIDKDGNFSWETRLIEGAAVSLRYRTIDNSANKSQSLQVGVDVKIASKDWNVPLYLEPGDTLRISADGNDLINTLKFSGKPAKSALFGLEFAKRDQDKKTKETPYSPMEFSALKFMQDQEADRSVFLNLYQTYRTQLSDEVLEFHKFKFDFEQANARLDFLSKTKYLPGPDANEVFEGFPEKFFATIDTLPVLMVDHTNAGWYRSFLDSYKLYTDWKSGKFNGGNSGFFLGDYVLSLNYLRRFPLYYALADGFEDEIASKSWQEVQSLKPYYEDFNKNCGDTILTKSVRDSWEALAKWAPGKELPLKSITLADGSSLQLSKFKGKALSITFNYHYPEELRRLLERIKKNDPGKVHFLVVQIKEDGFPKSTIAEELKKLPQVTYVEVSRDNENFEGIVQLTNFDVKTFVVDADQRIIRDNINDSPNELSQDAVFEEAIRKALSPKKMSKEDKAELIKIIGWSVGSILFAGLIFLWIYRVRIANIKKKEALKRHIKELEIKAIRSQMNPHFMFNALNSIQSLINSQQFKEANIYLEKFSLLMRRVLNNSGKTFITLSEELEAVSLYAALEQLRFEFVFNISMENGINADLIEIPGMIIQPLVENAVLHGIAQKGTSGKLEIRISIDAGYLKIQVTDNGLGLKHAKNDDSTSGFGLKLVRERLKLLNEQGANGKLNISSNLEAANGGVTATLTIPID